MEKPRVFLHFGGTVLLYKNFPGCSYVFKSLFTAFDKDNTGTFGLAEIHHVLTNLGADLSMEEMQEILREVDVDGDNAVSFKGSVILLPR